MNRLKTLFKRLKRDQKCGLIAYVTCGDPDVATTPRIVQELERAGVDAVELGVPFSDPIADGPVIQAASQRALERGATTNDLFAIARTIRATSQIPLIAFSYVNPVMRYGPERFARDATDAGIDAILFTDLPPEAAGEIREIFRSHGMATVFLLAPTSSDKRVRLAVSIAMFCTSATDPAYCSTRRRHLRLSTAQANTGVSAPASAGTKRTAVTVCPKAHSAAATR